MKTEILFLAGMCLCACSRTPQEQASFPSVKVVHAEVMEAPSSRCYTFISQPYRLSELSFRVGGPVHAFDVQQGQFFRKGQLIAAIDERDFVIQKQRTEALYRQAEVDYARISSLYAKDNISGMNYEQAKANYERTKADYEAAVNAWEDSRLYAPFDGYVQQVHIERYQDVKPSVPVVTFIDLSRIKVEAYVPEDMALQIRQKDSVACMVRFNALPDREFVPSEYFLTQTATENNISYLLTAILDNKDGRLLGGMSGTLAVSYTADGEKNHLTLPQKVVCHDPEHGAFVWCVDGQSRVKRVAVTLGKLKKEDRVEILSGISPADRVITTRLPFLSEQEQVTIEE